MTPCKRCSRKGQPTGIIHTMPTRNHGAYAASGYEHPGKVADCAGCPTRHGGNKDRDLIYDSICPACKGARFV